MMYKYLLFFLLIITIPAISQINGNRVVKYNNTESKVERPVSKAALKLYPNPATNQVRIQNGEEVKLLKIYNILGVEVKSYKVQPEQSFDIIDLPKGMYFAQLIDRDSEIIKTVRFYKQVFRP